MVITTTKKIKQGKETGGMGLSILIRLVKKGITEKLTFEKRSEEGEFLAGQNFKGKMFKNISLLEATLTLKLLKSSSNLALKLVSPQALPSQEANTHPVAQARNL